MKNSRKHHRVPCSLEAEAESSFGKKHQGVKVVDLTIYGASLKGIKVPKGERLSLKFVANGVLVSPVSIVVSCREGSVGVRFIEVDPNHLLHIAAYLYTRMQLLNYRPKNF